MPEFKPAVTSSDHSPPNPVIRKYDESGRLVLLIEPAVPQTTVLFYGPDGKRRSSKKSHPT